MLGKIVFVIVLPISGRSQSMVYTWSNQRQICLF